MRAIEAAYTKEHTKAQAATVEPPVAPAAAFEPSMDWVVQLNLTGHNNREARTIARAVELGVSEYGAGYLASKAAEVQLRRLLAIMVAAQSGSTAEAWRGASQLEDVPGDGIGAHLPAVVQKSLRESLKLEYQLEGLLAGKMPDKKK